MTRHFTFRLSATVLAGALVLAACGDGDSNAAPQTTEPPATSTDTTVEAQAELDTSILTTAATGHLRVDGASQPLVDTGLDSVDLGAGEGDVIVGVTADEGLVMVPVDLGAQGPTGADFLVALADGRQFTGPGAELQPTADGFEFAGTMASVGDSSSAEVDFALNFSAGSSTFEVQGTQAVVSGTLGSNTLRQVEFLVANFPEVDTLVLKNIGGSVNDEVNVETGRAVRQAGYATLVPSDGEIYSGGVDLFAAGVRRIAEPGSVVGVHAWCCGEDGRPAEQLDVDDPAHDMLISYTVEMLGEDLGRDFYFFTVQSAPFDGIHEMTRDELATYLLTE